MSEQGKELQLEGVVRAYRYTPDGGKQFLGVELECSDGRQWIISYNEQSPFHAFADRRVLVSGEPYKPKGQSPMSRDRNRPLGHFRVTTMRLVEILAGLELVEVGAEQDLFGQFERRASATGQPTLFFVTDEGDTFLVANDPAGATVGRRVEVRAFPVQPSPSIPRPPEQWFWIICPCSMEDLWAWRERRS